MTSRNLGRLSNRLCNLARRVLLRRSSRALITRTRPMSGRSDSAERPSSLRALTPAFAGRMTRSSLTTAVGTEQTRITIKTGTTPFTTSWETLAGTIHLSLGMISSTGVTRLVQQSGMTGLAIKLEWRRARSGSVAVTWTKATAPRPGTSSAWNFSLRLTHWAAHLTKATRPKRLISRPTLGVVRLRKVVRWTVSKPPWKLKPQRASRW